MKNLDSVLEKAYKINSLFINTNKKLGLFGLLQLLEEIASEHALKLGFGYESYNEKGFFWVLVRQKLCMDYWPKLNDTITIKTWTKPVLGSYAIREYKIMMNNKTIGACSSTWMILDSITRKPKKIENAIDLFKPCTDYALDFTAKKISLPKDMVSTKTFEVRISDLDMNNHVNNIKYTQWILDSIPFKYHKSLGVKTFEINFAIETFLEDNIEIFSTINTLEPSTNNTLYFKGTRVKDYKTVFTAKLLTAIN